MWGCDEGPRSEPHQHFESLGNPKSDEMKSKCVDFFLPWVQVAKNWDQGTYEDYLGGLGTWQVGYSKAIGPELGHTLITLG